MRGLRPISFCYLAAAAAVCSLLAAGACRRAAVPSPSPNPAAAQRAAALPVWSGYGLRPAERQVVEEFLRTHRDLRAATDQDRRVPEADDVGRFYGVYHPYFLRGDLNDDGVLDFVLAFVRRDSGRDSPWFSVVVFTGKEPSGFLPGTFLERDVSLADGDLSVDRDSIVITPDLEEEDSTRRYRWDPLKRSHVFVRDEPEENEAPPLAQT